MANKISYSDFKIDITRFPEDLSLISESVPQIRKTRIEQKYNSYFDFLAILYNFRFVEKLSSNEIAEKMGLPVVDVHIHLYNLRWNYSDDYIKNKAQFQNDFLRYSSLLEVAKKNLFKSKLIIIPNSIKLY